MIKKILLAVPMTVALATSGTAYASASKINFGFIPFTNSITYVGDSLSTSTSITFQNPTFFQVNTVEFDDDSGAFPTMPILLSTLPVSDPLTFNYVIGEMTEIFLAKTFTTGPNGAPGSEGAYVATFTSILAEADPVNTPNKLSLEFEGTIVGPDGFLATDILAGSCDQSGGVGAVNCSFTQQTAVPEPGSLALLSIGLIGLGAVRRKMST